MPKSITDADRQLRQGPGRADQSWKLSVTAVSRGRKLHGQRIPAANQDLTRSVPEQIQRQLASSRVL